MTTGDLKQILARCDDDLEVFIPCQAHRDGTIGPSDGVVVKFAGKGFDWDGHRFLIYPDRELRAIEYIKYLGE